MRVRRNLACQRAQDILATVPQARQAGNIDPYAVAEHYGIVVRKGPLEDSLSGFLVHDGSGKAFIGINDSDNLRRQRFTLAHELGHYFLHDRSDVFFDTGAGQLRLMARDDLSKEGTDFREVEANLFAAELLMPSELIRRDLQDYTHVDLFGDEVSESIISDLARKYNVSVRAMTVRLERLGLLMES